MHVLGLAIKINLVAIEILIIKVISINVNIQSSLKA